MGTLDDLDAVRSGPLTYRLAGAVHVAPLPADVDYQTLLVCLHDHVVPDYPFEGPAWLSTALFERWAARHHLPEYLHAQRLFYIVDHHYAAAKYDLQSIVGVNLDELWRARRWNDILNFLDHLPAHCWYSESISNDEEYAQAVAEAQARRKRDGEAEPSSKPPLRTWSPEVAALKDLADEIRRLGYIVAAVQGAKPKQPEPVDRPETFLARAQKTALFEARKSNHVALAKRLVPHRYTE